MRCPFSVCALLALCLSGAAGQNYIDTFTYPAGTNIPGWTEQRGNWTCTGTAVQGQAGVTFQELTLPSVIDADAAVEVLAVYNLAAPGLQYSGPLVRYFGTPTAPSYFMAKVQDNGSPYTGWDYMWVYYYNAGAWQSITAQTISPPTTAARLRIQAVDEVGGVRLSVFLDTDLDGLWNSTYETLTAYGVGTTGNPGVTVYQSALADDFQWFSATLRRTALPTIGTAMPLAGKGTANFLYLAACSLGHSGFPLPGGAFVPLDIDPLFDLSLNFPPIFQNFSGFTAADGTFNLVINIPFDPLLVGATIWASAVTTDGIWFDVAPDVQITLQ